MAGFGVAAFKFKTWSIHGLGWRARWITAAEMAGLQDLPLSAGGEQRMSCA